MSESHPLYDTFCSELSGCIFEWDSGDLDRLRKAKLAEFQKAYRLQEMSPKDVLARITNTELLRHCRRRTRGPDETRQSI